MKIGRRAGSYWTTSINFEDMQLIVSLEDDLETTSLEEASPSEVKEVLLVLQRLTLTSEEGESGLAAMLKS